MSSTDWEHELRAAVRDVPDFPKPGIVFKDITPLLQSGPLFSRVIDALRERYAEAKLDAVVGIESRGFIFAAALAHALGVGLVLVRKPRKLPYKTIGVDYALEYGTDRLEMHEDSVAPGSRVVIVDDVLATGGTCQAVVSMIAGQDAHIVECAFLMELSFLEGRQRLGQHPTFALLRY